jgi:hypothetical protein
MKSRWLLSLLVVCAAQAVAQQSPPATESTGVPPGETPSPEAKAKIDEILEGEEAVLQGVVSSYDPGNRRDPFRSLFAPPLEKERLKRPEGVPGLLIDEITVRGIFRTAKGYVAQISAQNQRKSFLLREGEQVFDGDVLRIEKNQVVFRQIVNDPTVIKPFREVVKVLNP